MNRLTKYSFLEELVFFNNVKQSQMMFIAEALKIVQINKGKTIPLNMENEENVFFLLRGTMKIVNTNSVKYIAKKGDIFGELALYDSKTADTEMAYALENCIVAYLDCGIMKSIMEKYDTVKNAIIKVYISRIQRLERRLQDLLYQDSTTRITEFVLEYIKEFGEENHEGGIIAKNLISHNDIANLTNTSRQTVSNALSQLRKEGVINYSSQKIEIPNRMYQTFGRELAAVI